jgi:O-antigen ligase
VTLSAGTATATAQQAHRVSAAGSTRADSAILLMFILIPAAYLQNQIAGFQVSGWSWILLFGFLAPLALTEPVRPVAVRLLLPYLLFLLLACASFAWAKDFGETATSSPPQLLAQLVVPVLAYLVVWRVRDPAQLWPRLQNASLLALALAAVLVALTFGNQQAPFGIILAPRPLSMSLVVIFLVATASSTSWRYTCLIGGLVIAITLAAESRMATAVLLLMLLTSPSLKVRWQARIAFAIVIALLVQTLSTTATFKQRFFFDENATLLDAVTLSDQLNTAGRREVWPKLVDECSPVSLTGFGIGASYGLTAMITNYSLSQPHNDYLRIYCDVGWPGSVLCWGFFVWAMLRSWRACLGRRRWAQLHGVAAQAVLALLILAITDNPLPYTVQFMVPIAVILGFSDRARAEENG